MNERHLPKARSGPKATIRDVATRAGVAPATVSNVLTGLRAVSEKRRQRVLAAVDALSYQANHAAASLRRRQTRTIGIVVPNLTNEFFAALVGHFEQLAAETDYQILLTTTGDDPGKEPSRVRALLARQIDGMIVDPLQDDFAAAANLASELPPTVLVDRGFGHPNFDTVAADNFDAGYLGAQHLLQFGHRDLALLISGTGQAHIRDRVAGYRKAMVEAGLGARENVVIGGHTIEGCRGAIEQEMRRADRPTAIFAGTYFATLGAVKAIRALDLAFPEEISLLGFEHSEWMTVLRPYVSTVGQPFGQMASAAWRLLLRRIAGNADELARVRLPCQLRMRESVKSPRDIDVNARRRTV